MLYFPRSYWTYLACNFRQIIDSEIRSNDLTPLCIDQILYDLVIIFGNHPNLFCRSLYIMTKTKIANTADVSADKVLKTKTNSQSILVAKVGDKYCAIALS